MLCDGDGQAAESDGSERLNALVIRQRPDLDSPSRFSRSAVSMDKPATVFVNSTSDLFHAKVPLSFIRQVFELIADSAAPV